jgi:thiol-disulfide isomerase/thioredoxin
VRVVACVSLLVACLGLTGCASTPKKKPPSASVPPAAGGSPAPFWADPNAPPANTPRPSPSVNLPASASGESSGVGLDPEVSGILAGRLVDAFNRPITAASIQVTDARGADNKPQLDVDVVNQGHFTIRGLVPGRTYVLTARTRQDGRLLVGTVMARPPETKLLIPLSEDFVTGSTPPLPGPPQAPGRPRAPQQQPAAASGWGPAAAGGAPAAELGVPRSSAPSIEQIAAGPSEAPPRATIPPLAAPEPPPFVPTVRGSRCLVSGGRVQELTMTDDQGREWDFRQHRGRLVLLDFWGTWCPPCLQAIPELVRLDRTYGPRGLEVVGIACERGSPADNVRRVQDVRRRIPGMGYRVLMAETSVRDPAQTQFKIEFYPTLVLIDADGTILWRDGAGNLPSLEAAIRQRLGP